MKSELELLRAGVVFTRENGRVLPRGPAETDLRAEVASRMEYVRARLAGGPAMDAGERWGRCDTCGLSMQSHKAGICWVCSCALQKVLDERKIT